MVSICLTPPPPLPADVISEQPLTSLQFMILSLYDNAFLLYSLLLIVSDDDNADDGDVNVDYEDNVNHPAHIFQSQGDRVVPIFVFAVLVRLPTERLILINVIMLIITTIHIIKIMVIIIIIITLVSTYCPSPPSGRSRDNRGWLG